MFLRFFFFSGIASAYLFDVALYERFFIASGSSVPLPQDVDESTDFVTSANTERKNQLEDVPFPKSPKIAIVIDDLGWDQSAVEYYDSINEPLTMAVMPERPNSQWLYDRWKNKFEFIIHMPMEPLGYPEDDPGKMALMTSMSQNQVNQLLSQIFEKYPKARGLNNHMGSAFTQYSKGMNALMKLLDQKDMYYLDSLTTSRSVARDVARKWDVPFIENEVFLDRTRTNSSINNSLDRLVKIAKNNGSAVGIGHMQSVKTARVLSRRMPQIARNGIEFVALSRLVNSRETRRALE